MVFYIALGLLAIFAIGTAFAAKGDNSWDDWFAINGFVFGVTLFLFLVVFPFATWSSHAKSSYDIDDGTVHSMPGVGRYGSEYYFISGGDKYSLGDSDSDIDFSVGSANTARQECYRGGIDWLTPLHFWEDCNWVVVAEKSGK